MSPKARIREELKRAVSKHKARPGGGGGLEETPGWISTGETVEKWCSFYGETIGSMSDDWDDWDVTKLVYSGLWSSLTGQHPKNLSSINSPWFSTLLTCDDLQMSRIIETSHKFCALW